jgi:hypothetical protein
MESNGRKPGRPKASLRTTPLVFDTEFTFTKIEVALPAGTAKTLSEYIAWVQRCGDLAADAATTTTVDFALREVFRRDRLWREERRIPDTKPATGEPTRPAASLPPPSGSVREPKSN